MKMSGIFYDYFFLAAVKKGLKGQARVDPPAGQLN